MNFEMAVDRALRNTKRNVWHWRPTAKALPRARRFVLSDEASAQLGTIVADAEILMLENHQFAFVPYPITYIEYNLDAFLTSLGRAHSLTAKESMVDHMCERDTKLGYLMNGDDLTLYVTSDTENGNAHIAHVSGLRYRQRTEGHRWEGTFDDWERSTILLGTSLTTLINAEREDLIVDIFERWQIFNCFWPDDPRSKKELMPWVTDPMGRAMFNGEIRTLLAILLLLNQPNRIKITQVPRRKGWAGGKRITYMAHSVVNLELGRVKDYKRLFAHYPSDRASPRRHEVRGHFIHRGGREHGCIHNWPVAPIASPTSGAPTWECSRCGRVRVWRAAHLRGDASRGFSTKHYEVDESK